MSRFQILVSDCPRCGSDLQKRKNRAKGNYFLGCTDYPDCKFTVDYCEWQNDVALEMNALRAAARHQTNGSSRSLEGLLKKLVFRFHPDRNPDGVDATEVTKELNLIRTEIGCRE